jgi:hypothetical protein
MPGASGISGPENGCAEDNPIGLLTTGRKRFNQKSRGFLLGSPNMDQGDVE